MKKMKFNVSDLIELIRANRSNHRSNFEDAIEGYRYRIIEELNRRIDDVKAGRKIEHVISMPRPEDHTEDYDRALQMLELTTEKEIELTQDDFATYVRDDWGWKRDFERTNAFYTGQG